MKTCKKYAEVKFVQQTFRVFLNESQVVWLITSFIQVKARLAQSKMSGSTQIFV